MKSYKEILEALKGKQHKIDKNKNGQIDAHDFKLLRKEEIELDEATVKTQKYSWGTMKTVHHGADFSIPLHPEHHKEIAKLKDEQEHHFKTEDGKSWTARRKGDEVHFQGANGGNSTKVGFHTMKEEYENLYEEDHSELARKSAEEYRKALARGDSVAANAANAEHIRHKKAAMLMRKKSHIPGEIEEATRKEEGKFHSKLDTLVHKTFGKSKEEVKKEEVQLSEEHIVHVNDGSKYGEQPHDKDAEHVMAGAKKHGGEFDGHSDKGAYFKFKSHEDAKNFKRHVDSCPHKTCDADLHESVDFNKWVSGGKQTTPKPQKEVVEKEPENTVKGSQIKFLNTFREENQLDEKINLAKTGMGDVIKDFQKSDAPQFAGKTKEKRREMAIAAKLEADRQQNEGVIQPSGSDAMEVGIDKPKDTVVRDKKGNLISFKHESAWKKSTGTVTDKSGAKHSPMSRARDLARSAMKTVKEEEQIDERNKQNALMRKTMDASRGARYKLNNPVPPAEPEHKTAQAHNKAIGRALRNEAIETQHEYHLRQAAYHEKHGNAERVKYHKDRAAEEKSSHDWTRRAEAEYLRREEVEELEEGGHIPGTTPWHHNIDTSIKKFKPSNVKNNNDSNVIKKPVNEPSQKPTPPAGAKFKSVKESVLDKVRSRVSGELKQASKHRQALAAARNQAAIDRENNHAATHAASAAHDQEHWRQMTRYRDDNHAAKLERDKVQQAHYNKQRDKINSALIKKVTKEETNVEEQTGFSEQAPVAPVPGQKWKDHAVMVNGKHRVVIHRKNIGNYSKEEGWKEVAPGQKVKEDIDLDGNYVSEPMSYQEFAMMIEGRAQYMVKATHNKTGNVKVSTYVADKDESEYGVRSRAEREHKPMGYSINSVRRKDVEAHGEDEEDETVSTQKRGRGRPAGSKSGARGPRIK